MTDQIKNGKTDVLGINIDIASVLGDKIVDQYLAKLSDDDIQTLMNYITQDLFTERYDHKMVVKESEKNQFGSTTGNHTIGEIIRAHFNERIKEELKKKVEEIIASTDYKQKIDEIANELVEYSVNGYKEDMKNRVRQQLVGNAMDTVPSYGGMDLIAVINHVIDNRIGHDRY